MTLNSSDTSQGADALASQYNNLRADVIGALITPATTRYYAFGVGDFVPYLSASDNDWYSWYESLPSPDNQPGTRSRSDTASATFNAGIHLPHGAIVTSLKAYWYRTDAAATGTCVLFRVALTNSTEASMAFATSDSSGGYHSVEDTSISNATVDNSLYYYLVEISVNPNDDRREVSFISGVITYTIDNSLP